MKDAISRKELINEIHKLAARFQYEPGKEPPLEQIQRDAYYEAALVNVIQLIERMV